MFYLEQPMTLPFIVWFGYNRCREVHFGTMSGSAKNFFISQGFSILYKNMHSYLKPYTGKSYPYYILGKKIKNNGED